VGAVFALVPNVASAAEGSARLEHKSSFDSRRSPSAENVLKRRDAKLASDPATAVVDLRESLGAQGIVALDPLTSTPRIVARLDGFLTAPSDESPASVGLVYVRAHRGVFGLDAAALANLDLVRDYVSIEGTHHLYWRQSIDGIPVFGNGLRANVTRDGRLINVLGSPLVSLSPTTSDPTLTAGEAVRAAKRDAGVAAVPLRADTAREVFFETVDGPRIAYETNVSDASTMYMTVVDGATGAVLYRQSLVNDANAQVLDYYPDAPFGGVRHTVALDPWLAPGAATLNGPNAHVYSDVDDSNDAQPSEETPKDGTGNFGYPFTEFFPAACVPGFPCSWDPEVPNSWRTNQHQSATQLFYFINKFHDHLKAPPIGFTPAAGNFEGDDAIHGENLDGADTASGLPDANHMNNANFETPPDGIPGRMQIFLWAGAPFPGADPFLPANAADEADIVYHENAHGLSNRLVVDAEGNSTLGVFAQSGALGEAWSDWYAADFLNAQGFLPDTPASGEVRHGAYVSWGNNISRREPVDCAVGAPASVCPGGFSTGPGGFTYGDYGRVSVFGGAESHADGEIWAQTLWDLRTVLGSSTTENLVTRAMELSPPRPSFLDERNAILQADMVASGGSNAATIWSVFAHRGMGFFAGSVNNADAQPAEDFSLPPGTQAKVGKLEGRLTNLDTGQPISGGLVALGGHNSGFPGAYADLSSESGKYEIKKIFAGTYPKLFATAPGFNTVVRTVTIGQGSNVQDWELRRDWAALGGGGEIAEFNGTDYSFIGCGPSAAIDQELSSGWSSDSDVDPATKLAAIPKAIVIELPQAVDVKEFAVDPNSTCGDGFSASTKDYRIETSTDGTTFEVANQGSFAADRSDNGHLNSLPVAAAASRNVRYVRFTMLSPNLLPTQNCPGPFAGCVFMDVSEIEVYGVPANGAGRG
jgi:hypothetical protein